MQLAQRRRLLFLHGAYRVSGVQSSNDIYAPASGVITAVNEALEDEPELLNASAHGDGWIAEFKVGRARHIPWPGTLSARLSVARGCVGECLTMWCLWFSFVKILLLRIMQLNDLSELDELMDSEAYASHVEDSAH